MEALLSNQFKACLAVLLLAFPEKSKLEPSCAWSHRLPLVKAVLHGAEAAFVPCCCVVLGQGYFLVLSQHATPLWVTGFNFLYASYRL